MLQPKDANCFNVPKSPFNVPAQAKSAANNAPLVPDIKKSIAVNPSHMTRWRRPISTVIITSTKMNSHQ